MEFLDRFDQNGEEFRLIDAVHPVPISSDRFGNDGLHLLGYEADLRLARKRQVLADGSIGGAPKFVSNRPELVDKGKSVGERLDVGFQASIAVAVEAIRPSLAP